MRPIVSAMGNDFFIVATGVHQGIGKNWHAVESSLFIDGLGQVDDRGDSFCPNRFALSVSHLSDLMISGFNLFLRSVPMRVFVLSGLMLALFSLNLVAVADDPKPTEPTAEQIAEAKEAYAKFRADYVPISKYPFHCFDMPNETTDADLKGLPDLPFRYALNLSCTKVTDAGLKELKELKNITTLGLWGTKVTDDGLKELKNLKNLMVLDVGKTKVSDAGLKELKELKNLNYIKLEKTQVTDAGVKELQEGLPKCKIIK